MTDRTRTYRSRIDAPTSSLYAWHHRPGAFERLTPPWASVETVDVSGTVEPGDWKRLRVGVGPFKTDWTVVHQAVPDGEGFVDIQTAGPFKSWRHVHRFVPGTGSSSVLEDQISYALPGGSFGQLLAGRIGAELDRTFAFRHRRTQHDVVVHERAGLPPLRIALTGASGLVGSQLTAFLGTAGHHVFRLVRRDAVGPNEICWNPASGEIDAGALEGMDAVIHLAGVSIANNRWSAQRKAAIRESRVVGTQLLADTLASLRQPPRVLVSASAVGFYGNGGARLLSEDSPRGEGFLAEVCEAWETATDPARGAGIRVVKVRLGVVIAGGGGLISRVRPLFQLGAGGVLGNGSQYMSWIALDDLLAVIMHAIADEGLEGPVNAVAPTPTTNRDFTKVLGRVLRRPTLMRAPELALRAAFGGLADELLLASQQAVPARLNERGFQFSFPEIGAALCHELGRSNRSRSNQTWLAHPAS